MTTKHGKYIKKPDSIFKIGKNFFIAPILKGNWANLMNHSCDSNVEGFTLTLWGRMGIFFKTTRDIKKGEEMFYDYGRDYFR